MQRKRIQPSICFSTEERKKTICRELASFNKKDAEPTKSYVLFLWGKPVKNLTEGEALEYKNLGARVEYTNRL